MSLTIRDLDAGDRAAWTPLWDAYCHFYGVDLPVAVTDATWAALIDPARPVAGRLALGAQGKLLGFAHHIVHPTTWTIAPACYLEDLFVVPDARGKGVGRALIDDLVALSGQRGWSRLYWHTAADNATARRLYDRYVEADRFVRYRLTF